MEYTQGVQVAIACFVGGRTMVGFLDGIITYLLVTWVIT